MEFGPEENLMQNMSKNYELKAIKASKMEQEKETQKIFDMLSNRTAFRNDEAFNQCNEIFADIALI